MTRDEWTSLFDRPETQELLRYSVELQARRSYRFQVEAVFRLFSDGISRRKQLDGYKGKRDQVREAKRNPEVAKPTFRTYTPLEADERLRTEVRRRAQAQGVAPGDYVICGHQGLDNRKCWLPPHAESVPHKY